MNIDEQKDEELWQMAKARVAFKWSFVSYFMINAFLITVWFFTSGVDSYFWPIWPLMGWGLGMAFQYFYAFHGNKMFNTRQEYEKLKNKQND